MKRKLITSAATDGQKKQVARFISDVIEKVGTEQILDELGVDSPGGQRVIEHGDELAKAIRETMITSINDLSTSDKFKNEEVIPKYGYLSGYKKPTKFEDQIDILRSHWPSLNPDLALHYIRENYPNLKIPIWVEGPFAIIRPGFFSEKYGEELEEVLKALAKDRKNKFYNYREDRLGPEYLRQRAKTLFMLRILVWQQQGSDILILPAQFGIRHAGRSVRRALEATKMNEYGIGAKDIGTMLLTNPIRLMRCDDLWIDCAGDKSSFFGDGIFPRAPFFYFNDDRVGFDTEDINKVYDSDGSASGFCL